MSGRHRDSDPARKSISVERTFTPTADVEQIKGKYSMKTNFGRYFSSRILSKQNESNRIILVVHFLKTQYLISDLGRLGQDEINRGGDTRI